MKHPAKIEAFGLLCGKNFIILTSTVFDWSTLWRAVGRTDRHTDGPINQNILWPK